MFQTLSSDALLFFLVQAAVLAGTALLLGRLAGFIGLPPVTGELCAGVLLGSPLPGHLGSGLHGWLRLAQPAQSHLIDAVGQIGVLLLVGLSATQLDTGLLRREARVVARVGTTGLVVPFALGVAAGFVLPGSLIGGMGRDAFAFFLGVAMAVSALPVIAKTLLDMGLLERSIGQLTLAASLVDDAAGWLLLSALSAFVTVRAGQRAWHIVATLAFEAGVALAVVLVGRPLARLIQRRLDKSGDPALRASGFITLILLAAAGTGSLGLEPVFGAFAGGLLLASADGFDPVTLLPVQTVVMGFLAPLFFATAGLRMDLGALRSPPVLAGALCVVLAAVTGKFAGAYAGARLSRLGRWEAIALGAGLNSRGVIQIVIATVGLRMNVLTAGSYSIIVVVAIVTSMMAAPILRVATRHIDTADEEDRRAGADKNGYSATSGAPPCA
jgi:K+:H+ antiporter